MNKTCKKSIDFGVPQAQDCYENLEDTQHSEPDFTAQAFQNKHPQYLTPNQVSPINSSSPVFNQPYHSAEEREVTPSYNFVNNVPVVTPVPTHGNLLIEITGPQDMINVPPQASVRIAQTLVERTYSSSHAFVPFGWNLVKAIYRKEERLNRSYNGNSTSKLPMSPRRKKACEVAIESMADRFEIKDALIKNANDCIVSGLRNECGKRLVLSELTPRIHNKQNV